jgi:hypothetical protein
MEDKTGYMGQTDMQISSIPVLVEIRKRQSRLLKLPAKKDNKCCDLPKD